MINHIQVAENQLPNIQEQKNDNETIVGKNYNPISKSSTYSFLTTNKIDSFNNNYKNIQEKNYEKTILENEIAKGYWLILFGIFTLIFLFGIGFIIIGGYRVNKAKKRLKVLAVWELLFEKYIL